MVAREAHNLKVDGSKPSSASYTSMAEWSNAPDLRSGLFGGAGSNPARCTTRIAQSVERRPFKPVVEGSSPSSSDMYYLFARVTQLVRVLVL